jgi:hypothetical protein
MRPMKSPIAAVCLGLAVSVVLGEHALALADPIASSWSGASASVYFGSQSPSQQGATAQASAGGTLSVDFEGSSGSPFQGNVTGSVAASAGSDPAHLLQVSGSSSAPDVGTVAHTYSGPTSGLGGASASWTNDAAIVTAPSGSALPGTIRLNFTLTFSDDHGIGPYANLTATFNGKQLSYSGSDWNYIPGGLSNGAWYGLYPNTANAGSVDSSTVTTNGHWATKITDTFHIDLPLNQAGVSNPLSLGLQLSPYIGLVSNSNLNSGLSANISLDSVTLPDGTSLSALGDSVSFESSLTPPMATPEPASLLLWGLVAAAGGATVVRRRAIVREY